LIGYSSADAAANFVFMTMVLFQTDFYTKVFGLTAGAASLALLLSRLWDAAGWEWQRPVRQARRDVRGADREVLARRRAKAAAAMRQA
jgi:hypothetical protein